MRGWPLAPLQIAVVGLLCSPHVQLLSQSVAVPSVNAPQPTSPDRSATELASLRDRAASGDASAQFRIGWLYARGPGTERNYAEAFRWYSKAAAQGNANAEAYLGRLYEAGLGVNRDYEQAVSWFRKAADQGSAIGQDMLGSAYSHGHGVKKDDREAFRWHQLAANQGNAAAEYNLGFMYETGRGVKRNAAQAAAWYQRAANQGDGPSQFILAQFYSDGTSVSKDYAVAAKLFHGAATQGVIEAFEFLTRLYENGQGVPRDLVEAYAWNLLTIQSGERLPGRVVPNISGGQDAPLLVRDADNIERAKAKLAKLESQLTAEQILVAQRRARDLLEHGEARLTPADDPIPTDDGEHH
jgi:TPR repeat protein